MKTKIFGKKAMVAALVSMVLAFGFVLVGCVEVYEASSYYTDENYNLKTVMVTATLRGSKFTIKIGPPTYEGTAEKAAGSSSSAKTYDITGDGFDKSVFIIVDKVGSFYGIVDGKSIAATGLAKKSVDGEEDVFEMTGTIEE